MNKKASDVPGEAVQAQDTGAALGHWTKAVCHGETRVDRRSSARPLRKQLSIRRAVRNLS